MRRSSVGLSLLALAVLAGPLAAQVHVGPALAVREEADLGIGGFVTWAMPDLHEDISLGVDVGVFFPDGFDYFEVNGNVYYTFPTGSVDVAPWVLGGLVLARVSDRGPASDTELGLNLGGGVTFRPQERISPLVGGKFELLDGSAWMFFAGLSFALDD